LNYSSPCRKLITHAISSPACRDDDALRRFERWTIVSETYHLALFCLFAVAVGWVVVRQRRVPLQLAILGCVVNVYLVVLQRYNRARIRATLRRMECRAHTTDNVS